MNVESEIGALRAEVANLKGTVKQLRQENDDTRALLNKGRGAVWVIGLLGMAVSFLIFEGKTVLGFFK